MIVSEHVAPPLSDISTFKAIFGLRRLELSDSGLIICLPWALSICWICIVKTTSDHLWVKIITTISWRVCQRHIGNLTIDDQSSIIIMLPSRSLKTMTSRNAQCRRFYMDFEQNGGNLTRQIIIVETQLRSLLLLLSLVQGYSPSSVTWSCCVAWALLFHEWVWFPFLLLYTLPDYFLRPLTQFMFRQRE